MEQEEIVLCGASAYTKKFYLNPLFNGLPEGIQEDLKILCVLYTEDVGGTLSSWYLTKRETCISGRNAEDGDFCYMTRSAVCLKIKQMQREKTELLLESLRNVFYRVFFLGRRIHRG